MALPTGVGAELSVDIRAVRARVPGGDRQPPAVADPADPQPGRADGDDREAGALGPRRAGRSRGVVAVSELRLRVGALPDLQRRLCCDRPSRRPGPARGGARRQRFARGDGRARPDGWLGRRPAPSRGATRPHCAHARGGAGAADGLSVLWRRGAIARVPIRAAVAGVLRGRGLRRDEAARGVATVLRDAGARCRHAVRLLRTGDGEPDGSRRRGGEPLVARSFAARRQPDARWPRTSQRA